MYATVDLGRRVNDKFIEVIWLQLSVIHMIKKFGAIIN